MKLHLSHALSLLFGFGMWEYWLGKTEKFVASSTFELIELGLKRLLRGRKSMEKQIVQGEVGGVKLTINQGKVRLEGSAAVGSVGASAGGFVEEDTGVLLDKLFAEIEAKSPPGATVIEEGVKQLLKNAAMAI